MTTIARIVSVIILFTFCSVLYFGLYMLSAVCLWGIFICLLSMICFGCCFPQCLFFHGIRKDNCSTNDRRDFCSKCTIKYKVHDIWLMGWMLCIVITLVLFGCFFLNMLEFRGSWFSMTQGKLYLKY